MPGPEGGASLRRGPVEDEQADGGGSGEPGQLDGEVAGDGSGREAGRGTGLQRAVGGEERHEAAVGGAAGGDGVLQARVETAGHHDGEHPLDVPAQQGAEDDADGAVGQGRAEQGGDEEDRPAGRPEGVGDGGGVDGDGGGDEGEGGELGEKEVDAPVARHGQASVEGAAGEGRGEHHEADDQGDGVQRPDDRREFVAPRVEDLPGLVQPEGDGRVFDDAVGQRDPHRDERGDQAHGEPVAQVLDQGEPGGGDVEGRVVHTGAVVLECSSPPSRCRSSSSRSAS